MGYTHYYVSVEPLPPEAFGHFLLDAKRIVDATTVPLAGPYGTGKPELNEGGIDLNGAGDDAFETFTLVHDYVGFNYCKTEHRAYDEVVTALLIRAKHHLGKALQVRSDGTWAEWSAGAQLVKDVFGKRPRSVLRDPK